MKGASAALAIGLFFAAGIAGSVFWRAVGTGPAVPAKSGEPPPVSYDYASRTIPTNPAMTSPPANGAGMAASLSAVAPQPDSPPHLAPQSPVQPPETRRRSAQQASAAPPVTNAKRNEDASGQRDNGLTAAADTMPRPATKHAPAPQRRLATAKPAPARAHGAVPAPASVNGPFQVQFGAFISEENAKRLSRALSTPQVKIDVQRGQSRAGRALFFVRSPVFDGFAQALAAAWEAQNAAQAQRFAEPVKYVILHGSASPGAAGAIAISQ